MARPTSLPSYLATLDEAQRGAIAELRRHAAARLTGFRETFEYGMPYFRRGTGAAIGFAVRGSGVAIYAGDRVLSGLTGRLAGIDCGKGCVRFARRETIDWTVVDAILDAVERSPT